MGETGQKNPMIGKERATHRIPVSKFEKDRKGESIEQGAADDDIPHKEEEESVVVIPDTIRDPD